MQSHTSTNTYTFDEIYMLHEWPMKELWARRHIYMTAINLERRWYFNKFPLNSSAFWCFGKLINSRPRRQTAAHCGLRGQVLCKWTHINWARTRKINYQPHIPTDRCIHQHRTHSRWSEMCLFVSQWFWAASLRLVRFEHPHARLLLPLMINKSNDIRMCFNER